MLPIINLFVNALFLILVIHTLSAIQFQVRECFLSKLYQIETKFYYFPLTQSITLLKLLHHAIQLHVE